MKNKTLLMLGMGHSQIDLAQAAHEYGAKVYACARHVNGPARDYVDGCRQVDILDIDGIVNYAKEIKADAIFSVGLEIALEPIARASEQLGLYTYNSSETLSKLDNKVSWRQALKNASGKLEFMPASKASDLKDWDLYPAILKPADGAGQRGVIKVNNFAEVESNFAAALKYSSSGLNILEEFAGGDEISVNSFMSDGKLRFSIMSDRISYQDVPGGIIKEHHIPSIYDTADMAAKVHQVVEDVNRTMGFRNGHIYFQLKIYQGKVALIEFTPRFDGCHMWRLIKTATGLDLLQVTLEKLLDASTETLDKYTAKALQDKRYFLKFNSDLPGKVVDYKNYYVEPDASYNYWYYQEGEKIKTVTSIIEKVGYYIYSSTK